MCRGYAEKCAGCSAQGGRVVEIAGVAGDDETVCTEGLTGADQGAEVAGVLRAVGEHDKGVALNGDAGAVSRIALAQSESRRSGV